MQGHLPGSPEPFSVWPGLSPLSLWAGRFEWCEGGAKSAVGSAGGTAVRSVCVWRGLEPEGGAVLAFFLSITLLVHREALKDPSATRCKLDRTRNNFLPCSYELSDSFGQPH